MAYVFAGLATIFLLGAVHPFTTYPLSLWVLRRLGAYQPLQQVSAEDWAKQDPVQRPSFSICLCGYNEAAVIVDKIENLQAVAKEYGGNVEILIYTDGCDDSTAMLARRHLKLGRVIESADRTGKSVGMTRLGKEASGELVLFTDANVMLDKNALDELARAFTDPDVGCACGHLIFTNPAEGDVATVGSAYWRLEEFIKRLESETGSTMGADGAMFAVRRSLFRPVPDWIIDDMFTSVSILCDGHRVVSIPEALAYEKSTTQSGDEFRRKVRIACRAFNCHRHLAPQLLRMTPLNLYKYASHKLLRWLVIYFLVLSIACSTIAVGLSGHPLAAMIYFLTAVSAAFVLLTFFARLPKLRRASEVVWAFIAVGIGIWHSIRGRRYQTWLPPQSAR
ncbi:MAG: glycosyltransferase [Planctomycetaceae bacterium]